MKKISLKKMWHKVEMQVGFIIPSVHEYRKAKQKKQKEFLSFILT